MVADFDKLLARARRLELKSRYLAGSQYAGLYRSAFRGQGMEFSEVREYAEGDEVRLIDWNVSARHQSLFIKRMIEERERNVLLVVDASGSLAFGSARSSKFDLLIEIGALLVLAAFYGKDRVSLAVMRTGVERFIPAAKSWNHAARLIRELASIEAGGFVPGLDPLWNFLNSPGLPRSLVLFLTDYQAPLLGGHSFAMACRKHEMVFFLATDPREWQLPNVGRIRVRDPETGQFGIVSTGSSRVRADYERAARERGSNVQRLLGKGGADFVEVSTGAPYESTLRRFLLARANRRHRR